MTAYIPISVYVGWTPEHVCDLAVFLIIQAHLAYRPQVLWVRCSQRSCFWFQYNSHCLRQSLHYRLQNELPIRTAQNRLDGAFGVGLNACNVFLGHLNDSGDVVQDPFGLGLGSSFAVCVAVSAGAPDCCPSSFFRVSGRSSSCRRGVRWEC